ncbi:MAG: WD40 repeat domain-containing serine/threonine protein kinase, partial [Planctomycetota bacterium]
VHLGDGGMPKAAQVHAAGVERLPAGDRPYIVMELVDAAQPLTTHATAGQLPTRERVALFARACGGVAHAHAAGVIHRDLKPANILVSGAGEPKVIDFGVGRSLAADGDRLTTAARQGELLGTVRYMSPEQLGVDAQVIDARSDVYSLGLVLHELLTGELPYELRGRSVMEAACVLARSSGVATKPLAARLRRAGLAAGEAAALAAIVATCLEPLAADRYPHAGELEADLARWLAGDAVRARPPSLGDSLARLARRHRAAALGAAAAFFALAVAVVAVAAFWLRAEGQRRLAEQAQAVAEARRLEADARTAEARRQVYLSTVLLAAEARDRDNLAEARRLLGEAGRLAAEQPGDPVELDCLTASLDDSLAVLADNGGTVSAVAWSPDGAVAAIGTTTGRLKTWRPAAPGPQGLDHQAHDAAIWDVAFGPDGRLLASASADGTVRIHDSATGDVAQTLVGHGDAVYAADFSADGGLLATGSRDRTIRLWDTRTWRESATLRGHEGTVYSVRFSPGGDRLVSAAQDGTVRTWTVADSALQLAIAASTKRVFRAVFSPDGARIAAAAEDGAATIWDAATGTELARLDHPTRVNAVGFFAGGRLLATASGDGLLRNWDATTGVEVARRRGHDEAIWSLALRSNEAAAVSGSGDGSVRAWNLAGEADPVLVLGDRGQALAITAAGDRLAAGDAAGRVTVADPRSLRPVADFDTKAGRVNAACFAPDGSWLALACDDGRVHRWQVHEGRPLPPLPVHTRRVYCVDVSPDGASLATGCDDRTARVVDAHSGAERLPALRHPARVFGAAFHPAGARLATACGDRVVRIWCLETGRELAAWRGHDGPVNWVCFSPSGDRLASASSDGSVRIWDVDGQRPARVLTGPARQVWRVAFSPDGTRVAATVADGTVQLWDSESGRPVAVLRGHADQAWGLAFLPGGHGLTTASWDGTVRLWGVSVAALAQARHEATLPAADVRAEP